MKAFICDHCGKKIDCLPHSTALERCMNRHRIRMKARQGGNENVTLEDMPTRATTATITIFFPTHCSITVPPNIEEIDLCPECRQIFNGWIAAFFHLGETDFDSVYIAPQGSPNCAEEQTTLDSGSIGGNAAEESECMYDAKGEKVCVPNSGDGDDPFRRNVMRKFTRQE